MKVGGRAAAGTSVGMGVAIAVSGAGEGIGTISEPSPAGKAGVGSRAGISGPLVSAGAGVPTDGGEALRVRGTIRYTFAGSIVGGAGIAGVDAGAGVNCAGSRVSGSIPA